MAGSARFTTLPSRGTMNVAMVVARRISFGLVDMRFVATDLSRSFQFDGSLRDRAEDQTQLVNIPIFHVVSMSSKKSEMIDAEKGLFEGLIEALADKHSQLDLNFQRVSVRVPGIQQVGVELNGTVTLSVHMRDLSNEEKQALASKNVAMLSK